MHSGSVYENNLTKNKCLSKQKWAYYCFNKRIIMHIFNMCIFDFEVVLHAFINAFKNMLLFL